MAIVKSKQKKIETFLKWEKRKVEKAVQEQLFERAGEITDALIGRAIQGDVNAINTAYDRMFGKAKQTVDVDTGGAPIIFMPAVLVEKFQLGEAKQDPLKVEAQVIYDRTPKRIKSNTTSKIQKN